MRIAVAYENGQVFQHLGKTPQFKFYDVENGSVTGSRVVATSGGGHGAIPGFLGDSGIGALICGGLGAPMRAGIETAGIELYAGIQGDADEAVAALLAGDIDQAGNEGATHECHHQG